MTEVAVNHTERLQTVHSVLKCRTDAESSRKELATDLSEALVAANIPVEKLDHPAIRRFLEKRVPGAGAIPTANRIRQWYLPVSPDASKSTRRRTVQDPKSGRWNHSYCGRILRQRDRTLSAQPRDDPHSCRQSFYESSLLPRRSDLPGQDRSQSGGSRSHESYQQVRRQTQPRVLAYITDNVAYMSPDR